MEVPHALAEKVRRRIVEDMHPSRFVVFYKSGFSAIAGGALSLLVCGQFGVGITHAAMHLNRELHHHGHDHLSALLCGAAFALISPFILRMMCSPLQYRAIVRNPHVVLLWFASLGAILAHHGEVLNELAELGLWCAATVVTFQVTSFFIDRFGSRLVLPWFSTGR